jgi:hypothetical protein
VEEAVEVEVEAVVEEEAVVEVEEDQEACRRHRHSHQML